MIVDATCTPADIRYPTDMSILNEARMNAEIFIDYLYSHFRYHFENKPRDYREVAHKNFIAYFSLTILIIPLNQALRILLANASLILKKENQEAKLEERLSGSN